jgi:hypothetical protein
MKKVCKMWLIPFFGIILALSACSKSPWVNENAIDAETTKNNYRNVSTNDDDHSKHLNSVKVIPSIDREKKRTTDEHGDTTNGVGTNVYSLIGSSSLHDGGISSHLESRLSGEGIPGVKVFVLDDTIILARAKQQTTSTRYDNLQNHVLRGTNGMSGKGEQQGVSTKNNNNNIDDNLQHAKRIMNDAFGGNVQILTITNPKAPGLIDRIKSTIKSSKPATNQLSSDISTLIKMTAEK